MQRKHLYLALWQHGLVVAFRFDYWNRHRHLCHLKPESLSQSLSASGLVLVSILFFGFGVVCHGAMKLWPFFYQLAVRGPLQTPVVSSFVCLTFDLINNQVTLIIKYCSLLIAETINWTFSKISMQNNKLKPSINERMVRVIVKAHASAVEVCRKAQTKGGSEHPRAAWRKVYSNQSRLVFVIICCY